MSINEEIKRTVGRLVPLCVPSPYTPTPDKINNTEYVTFNYTALGDDFGDDTANAIRYLLQIHWFLPTGTNPMKKKKQIKCALLDMGCTYPEVFDASDEDGQHFVFEAEYTDGDV